MLALLAVGEGGGLVKVLVRSAILLCGTVCALILLTSCGLSPAAAPVTSTVPTTLRTTATVTATLTPPAVTRSVTVTESADATEAWLPISLSSVCEMLAADAPDGTDGPAAQLATIMVNPATSPTPTESAALVAQLATINTQLMDIARHAPSEMASNFAAVIAFSQRLHNMYAGTTSERSFDMAEFKVPMLALLDKCDG